MNRRVNILQYIKTPSGRWQTFKPSRIGLHEMTTATYLHLDTSGLWPIDAEEVQQRVPEDLLAHLPISQNSFLRGTRDN